MKINIHIAMLLLVFYIACKQDKKLTNKSEPDTKSFYYMDGNKHQPDSLFPKLETFEINNSDTFIKTNNKVTIYLSKDAFVNQDGEIVEKYILYVVEAFSKETMLLSGLQTLAGSVFLESRGMFNIGAFDENGIPLKLKGGKSIGIELPVKEKERGMQLYMGENKNGGMNWINPVDDEKYLVNIALPKDNWVLTESLKAAFDTVGKTQQILESYIATREFIKTRLPRSSFTDSSAYFKIYMQNMGKNLYQADSLCMVYEKNSRYKWADGFKKGIYTYDKNSKTGMHVDTAEYYYHYLEKLAKPKIINTFGIDLDNPDAREELKRKGLSEKEIDDAFMLHNRRKNTLKSMQNEEKFTYYFEINTLGWYNFDKELGFENAAYVHLKTDILGSEKEYTNLYYVLDNYTSVISGHNISGNSYCLQQKSDYKVKLPMNEPITVVALSFTENAILCASEKIKIGVTNDIKLNMKPISQDSLKTYLKAIL